MTIINDFEYIRPSKIEEIWDILNSNRNVCLLAGGTDLIGNLKNELVKPKVIVDIKALKGLANIKFSANKLFIGPLVTFDDLIHSETILKKAPVIMEMAKVVASKAIRNRATVVGNICSAVPSMDSGAILSIFDAEIMLSDGSYDWGVPVNEWFQGVRKTALKKNQMVMGIKFSIPKEKHGGCYMKLSRYRGEDIAQATCAVSISDSEGVKLSFGSVAPVPVRATSIEKFLNENELNDETMIKIKNMVEKIISPVDDIRASKVYRTHMIKVMLERSLQIAFSRLKNEGKAYGTCHF